MKDTVIRGSSSESKIQAEIRLALSESGVVLRLNSGEFWQGKRVWSNEFNCYVLINLRPVHGCPPGTADLLWLGDGRAVFIETKKPGEKPTADQLRFIDRMDSLGIVAGVAYSVEDAVGLVKPPE